MMRLKLLLFSILASFKGETYASLIIGSCLRVEVFYSAVRHPVLVDEILAVCAGGFSPIFFLFKFLVQIFLVGAYLRKDCVVHLSGVLSVIISY